MPHSWTAADPLSEGNKSLIQEHLESMHDSIPGDNTTGPHSQAWSLGERIPLLCPSMPDFTAGTMPKVFNLSPLPTDGKSLLHAWFKTNEPTFHSLFTFFRHSVALEWRSYNIMREKGLQHAWWPSTEHSLVKPAEDVTFVESAHGDQVRTFSMQTEEALPAEPAVDGTADVPELAGKLTVALSVSMPLIPCSVPDGRLRPLLTTMFDATASWWTQVRSFPAMPHLVLISFPGGWAWTWLNGLSHRRSCWTLWPPSLPADLASSCGHAVQVFGGTRSRERLGASCVLFRLWRHGN